MFKFIRRIKEYCAREAARNRKLETMFQPGKEVRYVEDGEVYLVKRVELCAALVVGKDGARFFVDWFTPGGTIRSEVADDWEPVLTEPDPQMRLQFD